MTYILAGLVGALAFAGHSRLTRCKARSPYLHERCTLDRGHSIAKPHVWRGHAWWDWETA